MVFAAQQSPNSRLANAAAWRHTSFPQTSFHGMVLPCDRIPSSELANAVARPQHESTHQAVSLHDCCELHDSHVFHACTPASQESYGLQTNILMLMRQDCNPCLHQVKFESAAHSN